MEKDLKDVLLKDLCARLPYGVKVAFFNEDLTYHSEPKTLIGIECINNLNYSSLEDEDGNTTIIEFVKPYLFPLSSITDEQKEEYYSLADDVTIKPGQGSYFGIKIHCIKLGISDNPHEGVWDRIDLDAIDWLNAHHFDYRDLIPKGLALDATGKDIY